MMRRFDLPVFKGSETERLERGVSDPEAKGRNQNVVFC